MNRSTLVTHKEIELLAPGGDVDSIKAAIIAGANAIYCGLDKFNARNRAENITFNDLQGILRLAHSHHCEVFLTLNIIIVESEFPALIALLNRLVNTRIDGVIVQDLGLFYLLSRYFPTLKTHASTQLTTHNEGQIKFLARLGATRVNLSRELNLAEIQSLAAVGHQHHLLTEVFVHGSNCISFSGLCYMSSVAGGNSGNRGRCSQPCRDQYLTTAEGKDFPLNIKDNSAYGDLRALADAGVDSIKVEGRIKKYHYVYTVIDTWRKQLQNFYQQQTLQSESAELRKVFNRDFTSDFLRGGISREVFIDDPRDNSAIHRAGLAGVAGSEGMDQAKRELYEIKTGIIDHVKEQIDQLSIERGALTLGVSGTPGARLRIVVTTPETSFCVQSDGELVQLERDPVSEPDDTAHHRKSRVQPLDHGLLMTRLKALNETEYFIAELNLEGLQGGLFIPFKELNLLRDRILFLLNDGHEYVRPVELPRVKQRAAEAIRPRLSLLIASSRDLSLCEETSADIYFQLPNSFAADAAGLLSLFTQNRRLIPWFPAILIGADYEAAVSLLKQLRPERIVTNNSGIAFEACTSGIAWVAGPFLNLVNSYSLLCLQQHFNCAGAFLSNEISKEQLRRISKPDGFKLYYSISHPISLMTSRVCMFHQVTGCKKNIVDDACVRRCDKSSYITNLKNTSYFIKKSRGNYHGVYNEVNFLNTEIVTDIPHLFDGYAVDLSDIKTDTRTGCDRGELVRLFEQHLSGCPEAAPGLHKAIQPTTNSQYRKGI